MNNKPTKVADVNRPCGTNSSELPDRRGDLVTPSPHARIDLRDAHAIRRELAAVYRDMRSGEIQAQDGTRLAYVLDLIRKAFETGVLQDRLEALESTIVQRRS